ncbi:hypothetical protein AB0D99_33910 [Streptomyces sp. NPDC047971]|uniref:hypothetical protein n=1 Tax=Streptomyces sp. NPDC047971 TaxID=3154499 RepID=UPI0033C9835E
MPTTIERHKTMGIYAPLYSSGPCSNTSCSRNQRQQDREEKTTSGADNPRETDV